MSQKRYCTKIRIRNVHSRTKMRIGSTGSGRKVDKRNGPMQKWTADVSWFTLFWEKYCLSPILDMNSNEIISYNLSLILKSSLKQLPTILITAKTDEFKPNKMDASRKIPGSIHDEKLIIQFKGREII